MGHWDTARCHVGWSGSGGEGQRSSLPCGDAWNPLYAHARRSATTRVPAKAGVSVSMPENIAERLECHTSGSCCSRLGPPHTSSQCSKTKVLTRALVALTERACVALITRARTELLDRVLLIEILSEGSGRAFSGPAWGYLDFDPLDDSGVSTHFLAMSMHGERIAGPAQVAGRHV